jgi:hypothetical protein
MARYTDLDSAIKHLLGECAAKYPLSFQNGISAAAKEIGKFPTADVTEVVRCKDCLYSYFNTANETFSCQRTYPRRWVQEDDYCNYAKKEGVSEDATIY